MLQKKRRLTVAGFNEAFARGRRHHGTFVQLIHTPGTTFHGAAVVGKKVFKQAVQRNLLRRRLYAVLYAWQTKHSTTATYICIAKPAAKTASFTEIKADLESLLARTDNNR